jgi:hypothetical protein
MVPADQARPSKRQIDWQAGESVDLVFEPGKLVLIRPEIERLDLAFQVDELLQEHWGVPKYRIRFGGTHDPRVRQALRERGELWRMVSPPSDPESVRKTIAQSRLSLGGPALYFYNPQSGTRWITCAEFDRLEQLDDAALAAQLDELREHCVERNRQGHPEIAFFGAEALRFGAPAFGGPPFRGQDAGALRQRYRELQDRFAEATPAPLRRDDIEVNLWREEMFSAIATVPGRNRVEGSLVHPSLESLLKIRWLPGGRFEHGEFIFESFLPPPDKKPDDPELLPFWDPLARGFITNFIREYGNLEYLNLGRVEAATDSAGKRPGRRGVFLAELKVRGESQPHVLFLRLQRWGIRERLEEKDESGGPARDLVQAILDTEEYLDYTLDRRLGCLQFGMRLPARVHTRRMTEAYQGDRRECKNRRFPIIYFERDCLPGIPSNRISQRKLNDPRYALALARLLGRAAAPNLIVGRTLEPLNEREPGVPLFDNGDEIVMEGADWLPQDIVLVDHSGAFADWRSSSLLPFAQSYAAPVNTRSELVAEPQAFAEEYLKAFQNEVQRIRDDYARRRNAFDGLFKHVPYDDQGSFACRWERILKRLVDTDIQALMLEIRRHIAALK